MQAVMFRPDKSQPSTIFLLGEASSPSESAYSAVASLNRLGDKSNWTSWMPFKVSRESISATWFPFVPTLSWPDRDLECSLTAAARGRGDPIWRLRAASGASTRTEVDSDDSMVMEPNEAPNYTKLPWRARQ